jgi:exodeoxyribonuclease VII large subunit
MRVSELALAIDRKLREVPSGWVEGEVRDIKVDARKGHCYLVLGDEGANLNGCLWSGRVARCQPLPVKGDLARAHYERVDFYAPYGKTSLIIDYIKPTGEGELLRRRAETLRKLQAAGYCDAARRKPLRTFPRRVGVVAAHGSHAKEDVIRHLRERFPAQDIVFCPAAVQGVAAVGTIIDALGRLQASPSVDVIILARGGGSVAELVPFDDERLCKAISACAVPVITSIGHTKDRPNCDHVAAACATVPAKAAELAIRYSANELFDELDRHAATLSAVTAALRHRSDTLCELWADARPRDRIADIAEDLEVSRGLLASRAENVYRRYDAELAGLGRSLDAIGARMPRPHALEQLRRELHEAGRDYITHHRTALDEQWEALADAGRCIPRPAALDLFSVQLDAARGRICEKRRDYGRALDRLGTSALGDARARLETKRNAVEGDTGKLRTGANRALSRWSERIAHLGELVDAKDFRRHGWVLVSDDHGNEIRTVASLHPGETVHMRFVDGEAAASVDHVKQKH